eukprot:4826643-Pleurochrysis_carterae.AAC.3
MLLALMTWRACPERVQSVSIVRAHAVFSLADRAACALPLCGSSIFMIVPRRERPLSPESPSASPSLPASHTSRPPLFLFSLFSLLFSTPRLRALAPAYSHNLPCVRLAMTNLTCRSAVIWNLLRVLGVEGCAQEERSKGGD